MIIIRPEAVPPNDLTDPYAVLTASNVAETAGGEAEWNSGTTYADGDIVSVLGTTQRRYESLSNGNTGNDPTTDSTNWLDLGATNRWKMFDGGTGTQTENADSIEITLEIPSTDLVNAIALFGLDAGEVEITVKKSTGETVYNKSVSFLIGVTESDWWHYFFGSIFGSIDPTQDIAVLELPSLFGPTIEIDIRRTGGTAKCGLVVVGRQQRLATSIYGSSIGIRDFSIKEADAFGNFTITERRFVKRAEVDLIMDSQNVAQVQRALANRRATPTVYIGSDSVDPFANAEPIHEELLIYGYYVDFDIVLQDRNTSRGTIEIEGL